MDNFELPDFNFDLDIDDSSNFVTDAELPMPVRYDRKAKQREYINGMKKQALTELIKELPPPDTDIYIIGNGSGGTFKTYQEESKAFEFGHFIPVLVEMLGNKDVTVYASTWTMNRQHATNLLSMVDSGAIKSLAVLTDAYFLRRESAVANFLVLGLKERGQRFLAFKNHVKAFAACAPDGRTVCVLSSANFSAQPRAENFTLSTDSGLYRFLRDEFFEAIFNNAKQ